MTRRGSDRSRGAGALLLAWGTAVLSGLSAPAAAQTPFEGEVRQLVTFTFLPGGYGRALELYVDQAAPLYEANTAMRSFRAFREVESPVPLGLMVVSSFDGMAGMDASNQALSRLAAAERTSIRSLYGEISDVSSGHTDEFVEMLPELGQGDPAARRLTAFIWYELTPGSEAAFEALLRDRIVPLEASLGRPASTGRFLLSDGWHYLRTLGLDSLADWQAYLEALSDAGIASELSAIIDRRRESVLGSIPQLQIR